MLPGEGGRALMKLCTNGTGRGPGGTVLVLGSRTLPRTNTVHT